MPAPYFQHIQLAQKMLNIIFNLYPKHKYLSEYHRTQSLQIIKALPTCFFSSVSTNPLKFYFQNSVFSLIKLNVPIFFLEQRKLQVKATKQENLKSYLLNLYDYEGLGFTWYELKLV